MNDSDLSLSSNDVAFLAARVRRVCNLAGVPLPASDDDRFIVSVAGTLLGTAAFNLERASTSASQEPVAEPVLWQYSSDETFAHGGVVVEQQATADRLKAQGYFVRALGVISDTGATSRSEQIKRVSNWLGSLPKLKPDANYWTSGAFANDCREAANVLVAPASQIMRGPVGNNCHTTPLCTAATQARPASGEAWISVDERLPEHGRSVLILLPSGGMAVSVRRGRHWRDPNTYSRDEEFLPPSHWMPLPSAAKKD